LRSKKLPVRKKHGPREMPHKTVFTVTASCTGNQGWVPLPGRGQGLASEHASFYCARSCGFDLDNLLSQR
jgi:hypothetical protein